MTPRIREKTRTGREPQLSSGFHTILGYWKVCSGLIVFFCRRHQANYMVELPSLG